METNSWEKSIIEKMVMETISEQKRKRRWGIFFKFIWLIFTGIIIYYATNDIRVTASGRQVAVINLTGVINYENKTYSNLADSLQEALNNKDTVGVIIRANSPGGSPVYSNMMYDEITRLRKKYPKIPIYMVVEEVCASGCYYAAVGADKIFANQASIIGSIGVISAGFGFTELMDKVGVDSRLLISGKNKAMGYPFIKRNHEQDAMQQQLLDEIHQQFIEAVQKGRGKRLTTTESDLFSGRYWIGQDALKLGLIDGYATVDSLVRDTFKTNNIVDYTIREDILERFSKKFGASITNSIITNAYEKIF